MCFSSCFDRPKKRLETWPIRGIKVGAFFCLELKVGAFFFGTVLARFGIDAPFHQFGNLIAGVSRLHANP